MEEKTIIGTISLVIKDYAVQCGVCGNIGMEFISVGAWGNQTEMCVDCFMEVEMAGNQRIKEIGERKGQ